jgi:hypothetical protein
MKLTIGMACYKDFDTAWFTIQSLRINQDLTDTEILVVDNFGDDRLQRFVGSWTNGQVRYVRWTDVQGSGPAKGRVFAEAKGAHVICIDPHIILWPGSVKRLREWFDANPGFDGLVHGPLFYDQLTYGCDSLRGDFGGDGVWGTWQGCGELPLDAAPYAIEKMGMGCFGCRRDAWLGFPTRYKGFGGEEGIIHRKYAKAGRKVMLLPFLRWVHLFRDGSAPYPALLEDKVRNTVIGFMENGDSLEPVFKHFGDTARRIYQELSTGATSARTVVSTPSQTPAQSLYARTAGTPSDINEHLPTLARLATGKRVVEMGVRGGASTVGFIHGRPASLLSYDLLPTPSEAQLRDFASASAVKWEFRIGDSRQVDPGEHDVLFIDTYHVAAQLRAELANLVPKTLECIVLHDTVTFGERGEDGSPGLLVAVMELIGTGQWRVAEDFRNCNGLMVLRRVS